jgi:uncharacterized membrane protein YhaH (DUF805 family)
MNMELLSTFFLSHGRAARSTWLFRLAASGILCAAFGLLAHEVLGEAGEALFAVIFLWSAIAMSIQRLHDIGRSGVNMFLLLIPVLGPVWVLLLLCRRGGEGPNRYGLDPLARLDYLKVDISK